MTGSVASSVTIPLTKVARSRDSHEDEDDDILLGQDAEDERLLASGLSENHTSKSTIIRDCGIESTDTTYQRQAKIINKAITEIGLGKYQWQLFALCGLGWFADNLWMQGLALTLPQLSTEFGISASTVRYTTMFTFLGLSLGSTMWGIASDYIGRRPAFNATLFLCGLFGTAVAFGQSWGMTTLFYSLMGLGVGGNLPVDGALFLEFLPSADNKLLTLLSVWWPVGQLVAAILGWALIPPFSCEEGLLPCSMTAAGEACCMSGANRGWRYLNFSMGVITLVMFGCRFFLFHLYESPKFYLSRGQTTQAVSVVQSLASYNGTKTWLTDDILHDIGESDHEHASLHSLTSSRYKGRFGKFSMDKLGALFETRPLARTTIILWSVWFGIGLAFPLFNAFLPQYLEHAGQSDDGSDPVSAEVAYRNYLITSVAGVPGSFIAYYTVDNPSIGRKGTMAVSTLISGAFLFFFTVSSTPTFQVLCSSMEAFFQNIMYGVLYAYTPEVFPAPIRGTGTGVASLLNRIAGLMAPVVAAVVGAAHPVLPILIAGGIYVVCAAAMILLPIETRGMQSL